MPVGAPPVGAISSTTQVGYLPFGREYHARLPYVENSFITPNSLTQLTAIGYQYNANSVYDPRRSIGGHQPLQYDILQAVYSRVTTFSCECELTFSNPSVDGLWVGYRVRSTGNAVNTAGQTLDYIQEMRDCAIAPLNNTGSQSKTFRFTVPCARVLGISDVAYDDVDYSENTAGGAPTSLDQPIIEPFAVSTSTSGISDTVRYNLKMIFHSRFSLPITAPQS